RLGDCRGSPALGVGSAWAIGIYPFVRAILRAMGLVVQLRNSDFSHGPAFCRGLFCVRRCGGGWVLAPVDPVRHHPAIRVRSTDRVWKSGQAGDKEGPAAKGSLETRVAWPCQMADCRRCVSRRDHRLGPAFRLATLFRMVAGDGCRLEVA